jgi:hypothetical protein
MIAAKAPDHVERRNRNTAQRKARVALKRRFEHADRIPSQPVIVGDRTIERLSRRRRAGEFEPLLVFGHLIGPLGRIVTRAERR